MKAGECYDILEYNSNIIPIPVIASFNTSGKIKPIYFQFENENYKIMDVITSHTEVSTIYFDCIYFNPYSDFQNKITLVYRIKDHFWGYLNR